MQTTQQRIQQIKEGLKVIKERMSLTYNRNMLKLLEEKRQVLLKEYNKLLTEE